MEYLSFSKAKQIYGESLPEEVSDGLKFELQILKQRGASGYFLFLQDVVNTAQSELGIWVDPVAVGVNDVDELTNNNYGG